MKIMIAAGNIPKSNLFALINAYNVKSSDFYAGLFDWKSLVIDIIPRLIGWLYNQNN